MQNILSSSEIISLYVNDQRKKDETESILKIIREQVKRGSNLVLNVQKLSKMEEYKTSLIPFEIMKVLNDAINNVTQNLEEKTFEIQVDSSEKEFRVNANDLLIDVFENLIINAIRHNKNPMKKVHINVYRQENENQKLIKMEFKDNGPGIGDSWKKKIFLRGFGGDLSKRGLGIGLYLVKRIIDRYDGQIWVEDNIRGDQSKGSNFIISLPEANL